MITTKITVLFFGSLEDVVGMPSIIVEDYNSTNTLLHHLKELFPELKNRSYAIAVNEKIIADDTLLTNESKVALLPPYSGG